MRRVMWIVLLMFPVLLTGCRVLDWLMGVSPGDHNGPSGPSPAETVAPYFGPLVGLGVSVFANIYQAFRQRRYGKALVSTVEGIEKVKSRLSDQDLGIMRETHRNAGSRGLILKILSAVRDGNK